LSCRARDQELNAAVAAADRLLDFRQEKDEGERQPKFKDKGKKKKGEEADAMSKGQPKDGKKQSQGKRDLGCFICREPHWARDCPKKERLSALVIQEDSEDEEGEPFARVNPLQARLIEPREWQKQKLKKMVAQEMGQTFETFGQAEAMLELTTKCLGKGPGEGPGEFIHRFDEDVDFKWCGWFVTAITWLWRGSMGLCLAPLLVTKAWHEEGMPWGQDGCCWVHGGHMAQPLV
jgi:hypothetical protein